MTFSLIAVTGTFLETDGTTPARGRVTFTCRSQLRDSSTNAIRAPYRETAVLNASGHIAITLVANDDPTTQPTGTTYHVREEFYGVAVNEYDVVIPYTAPGATIDLADLSHVSPGVAVLSPLTGLGRPFFYAADNGFVLNDPTAAAANKATWNAFWIARHGARTYNAISYTNIATGLPVPTNYSLKTGQTWLFFDGELWIEDTTEVLQIGDAFTGISPATSTVHVTTAGGAIRAADPAGSGGRGDRGIIVANFSIDGKNAAGTPTATQLIAWGICAECEMSHVEFNGTAGNTVTTWGTTVTSTTHQKAACVFLGTQNLQFNNCRFHNLPGTAVLFDNGASSVIGYDCFLSGNKEDVRVGTGTGGQGTGGEGCGFVRGIIERDTWLRDKTFSIVLQQFDNFILDGVVQALTKDVGGTTIANTRDVALICIANENGGGGKKLRIRNWVASGTTNATTMIYATGKTFASPNGASTGDLIFIIFEGWIALSGMKWGIVANDPGDVVVIDNGIVNLVGITSGNEWAVINSATKGDWAQPLETFAPFAAITNAWERNVRSYHSGAGIQVGKRTTGSTYGRDRYHGIDWITIDPVVVGLNRPQGSLVIYSNKLYIKTGALTTDWTVVGTQT